MTGHTFRPQEVVVSTALL